MPDKADLRAAVLRVLAGIAPEADLDRLDPGENLRQALDIDSFDFLNFVVGLHKTLGVTIPEADYPRLATLDGVMDYLESREPGSSITATG